MNIIYIIINFFKDFIPLFLFNRLLFILNGNDLNSSKNFTSFISFPNEKYGISLPSCSISDSVSFKIIVLILEFEILV